MTKLFTPAFLIAIQFGAHLFGGGRGRRTFGPKELLNGYNGCILSCIVEPIPQRLCDPNASDPTLRAGGQARLLDCSAFVFVADCCNGAPAGFDLRTLHHHLLPGAATFGLRVPDRTGLEPGEVPIIGSATLSLFTVVDGVAVCRRHVGVMEVAEVTLHPAHQPHAAHEQRR